MNCESASVTSPSANTPTVWVAVTIKPSSAACHGVPRCPTRYAVTIDLPWPGESACAAPQKSAAASEARMTSRQLLAPDELCEARVRDAIGCLQRRAASTREAGRAVRREPLGPT